LSYKNKILNEFYHSKTHFLTLKNQSNLNNFT